MTDRDVIAELEHYIKSKLPREAMKAWFDSLSPEDGQKVIAYIVKRSQEIVATWDAIRPSFSEAIESLKESFERLGTAVIESAQAGVAINQHILQTGEKNGRRRDSSSQTRD